MKDWDNESLLVHLMGMPKQYRINIMKYFLTINKNMTKNRRIGITTNPRLYINKYNNGLYQHIILLYNFLDKNTNSNPVYITTDKIQTDYDISYIQYSDIEQIKCLDTIIMMGLFLPENIIEKCNEYDVKIVWYNLGHTYYDIMSDIIYDKKYDLAPRTDEIWVTPQFYYSKGYYEFTIPTAMIYQGPYFWSPDFLDISPVITDLSTINIGIFESNVSFAKSCIVPLCIGDKAYEYIDKMYILNGKQLEKNDTFNKLYLQSKLYKK